MRYRLIAEDGSVKKSLDIPTELLPIKRTLGVVLKSKLGKSKKRRKTNNIKSTKALINNGYNRNKRKSKTK